MHVKTGVAILLIGTMHVRMQARALDLESCLARVITNKVYQAPTASELTRARDLFLRTLRGGWTPTELTSDWAALGFDFCEVATPSESLWLLSDRAGKESGRGWYLFRVNCESSIALEAPHARNDVYTGLIALRLFLAGKVRVLAASTITRHRADMAHLDNTFFQVFTLAFQETCSTGLVVQLHGFESRNHGSANADIVVSAGTRSPESWLARLVRQLTQATSLRVLAYPRDTRQLGATLNAQGRALQQTRDCRFLHLEMSMELRKRLMRDANLRHDILERVSTANAR